MAILKGFPPSNTISPGPRLSPEDIVELQTKYGWKPSNGVTVKWRESDPWTCPLTGMVHYPPKGEWNPQKE